MIMRRAKVLLSSMIISIVIFTAATLVILIGFGNFGIAQGQANNTSLTPANDTSLTPEQKDAICNPNNPASKLNPVNTTESRICGIPKTVKSPLSNMTTSATTETGTETPSVVPTPPPTSPSPPPPPVTSIAPEAVSPPPPPP